MSGPQAPARVWRHPKPEGAAGLCVGARSDLPVHWRRAKRLARRIQALARRERLPHQVITSPLQRCASVGAWLRRWGWQHHRDPALLELDFGAWDGLAWAQISQAEVDAWVNNFSAHAPGGGESLAHMLQRVQAWPLPAGALIVSHGGWMLARQWLSEHGDVLPQAATWPRAPGYGECWQFQPGQVSRV
ncbi:MAG: histidine phosphatase family protein [Burkholderiaceae bacterium]|nr:histidine phosphatase family protein [Burkholderiaceae bacterium]